MSRLARQDEAAHVVDNMQDSYHDWYSTAFVDEPHNNTVHSEYDEFFPYFTEEYDNNWEDAYSHITD